MNARPEPSPDQAAADAPWPVIFNAASGHQAGQLGEEALRAALGRHPGRFDLRPVPDGDALDDAVGDALAGRHRTIIAAGGDGTVAAAAGRLARTGARLGILPMGTFNYVARSLDLPLDLDAAVDVIAGGATRPMPVAYVNDRLFLNNASLGLYPRILREREGVYDRHGRSRLAAYWSVIKTFARFRGPLRLRVLVDGDVVRRKTPLAFVARSAYQLDCFGLDGADAVRRGLFALYLAPDVGRLRLLGYAARLAAGLMRHGRDVDLVTGRSITIETGGRRRSVACDGERTRMDPPLRFRIADDALHVVVPATEGRP